MKILFQIYDRAGYTAGPVINAIRLLPALRELGYDILAIVGHNGSGHPNADYLEKQGVQCYKYVIPRLSNDHVQIFLEAIREFKPDIFVSNVSSQAAFAGRWARQWGIPVVHTHRSDDDLNNGMAQFFFNGPEEWRLSALVCVNNFLLNKIKGYSACTFRTKVIPSGVPVPDITSQQTNIKCLKVVYAGRIAQQQKRVIDMVDTFISITKKYSGMDFTLIGSGKDAVVNQLKEKIKSEGLNDRITFKGRLEGEAYKKELAKHQVIVLLSDYEGTPGSIMDGMSCGLVPVVLDINGIDELIKNQENGLIVKDRREDFERAVNDLLKREDLRKELSKNARSTIIDHFSLEKTVKLWDDLFKELKPSSDKNRNWSLPKKLKLPGEHKLLIEHRVKPTIRRRFFYKLQKIGEAIR